MSKYRQAARIDDNQNEIVKALRAIPGVTVELGHDDIFIGYQGSNYWIEIKDPKKTLKENGEYKAGAKKNSQIKLEAEWKGQYDICHSLEQVLEVIGL